jgi:hypothetical protein
VSDAATEAAPFFTFYEQGRVTAKDIDDFVEAWHRSGPEEQRSLAGFLGVTDTEYAVITMAPGALTVVLAARRGDGLLRRLLTQYLDRLRAVADPNDRPVILALGHWLKRPA